MQKKLLLRLRPNPPQKSETPSRNLDGNVLSPPGKRNGRSPTQLFFGFFGGARTAPSILNCFAFFTRKGEIEKKCKLICPLARARHNLQIMQAGIFFEDQRGLSAPPTRTHFGGVISGSFLGWKKFLGTHRKKKAKNGQYPAYGGGRKKPLGPLWGGGPRLLPSPWSKCKKNP